jgi:replicative DNA helicase
MSAAEEMVIACCVLNDSARARCLARLEVADFTDPDCVVAWRAIVYLSRREEPVNRLSMRKAALANGHDLSVEALRAFSETFPVVEDVGAYILEVRRASIRRQLAVKLARSLSDLASETRDHLLPELMGGLAGFLREQSAALEPERAVETVPQAVDRLLWERDNSATPLRWGLESMRNRLPRLKRGQFVVIAANTSVGKSTFMATHACWQARQGARVLWIGLEMSRDEVLASFCRVETGLDPSEERNIATWCPEGAAEAWAETFAPLAVDVRDDLHDIASIDSAVRLACMSATPPDIVYVDYLQRVRVDGAANDFARASAVSAGLKTLAAQTRIPVITASQFNRAVPHGEEPSLFHLKDSSSIEQDANIVLLLWRTDKEATAREDHALGCRVAKYRGAPTGDLIDLQWFAREGVIGDDAMRAERAHWHGPHAAHWSQRLENLRIPGDGG